MNEKTFHVVGIKIENVKKVDLVELEIKPDGGVIILAGGNGQGKSSALDAIAYAVGGGYLTKKPPIRDGQKQAVVELKVESGPLEGITIIRKWTEKSEQLVFKDTQTGKKLDQETGFLKRILGALSIDPLAFLEKNKKEQTDILLKLIGVNVYELDQKRKSLYEERTKINGLLRDKQGELEGMICPKVELPEKELSLSELTAKYQEAVNLMNTNRTIRGSLENKQHQLTTAVIAIGDLEKQLAEANKRKEQLETEVQTLTNDCAQIKDPDLESIQQEMTNIETTNRLIRQKAAYFVVRKEAGELNKESEKLTQQITGVDMEKSEKVLKAEYPMKGLKVDYEDGVMYNDQQLAALSEGEAAEVSTRIAMALNPSLKLIFISAGYLLDEERLIAVDKVAKEKGYTIIMQRVGKPSGEEPGEVIIMENGKVKAPEAKTAA